MHFTPLPEFPGGITLHKVVLCGSVCNGTPFIDSFSCLYLFPLLYLCSLHLPNTPLELQSFSRGLLLERASQLRLVVKNPPANAGDTRGLLGQEDPQEKEMATHSSILAWRIPWTEKPGGL